MKQCYKVRRRRGRRCNTVALYSSITDKLVRLVHEQTDCGYIGLMQFAELGWAKHKTPGIVFYHTAAHSWDTYMEVHLDHSIG